jgi:hypothetical protein
LKAIRTEAQFTRFSSRADGSVGFGGCTPEMSSTEKVALFDLHNVLCEILIYPKGAKAVEVIKVNTEMEGKSPSTRLRAVIFVLWKQKGEKEAFEMFYSQTMDKIIEWVKKKIDATK